MADEAPTAEEIEAQVAADLEAGVASFSDGTNSVSLFDPEKRLAAAREIKRQSVGGNVFLGHQRLIPGAGG